MPQNTPSNVKPPVLTFDENIFSLDTSEKAQGIWRDNSYLIYALPGRGKSSFLRSIVEHWGAESVLAMDIEKRLDQQGVPRIYPPDVTQYPENEQYNRLLAWWDIILDRAEKRQAPFNPQSRVIAVDTFNTWYDMLYAADFVRHYAGRDIPREKQTYQFQWYQALYEDILKRTRRMIRLTGPKYGYSVIFNCHVGIKKRKIEGEDVDQYEPQLPPVLQAVMNKETHCIFYLKASDGTIPNYFVTASNDAIPAKDQTGLFPRQLWPTWAAIEAVYKGEDPSKLRPTGIKLKPAKPEEKK